MYIIVNNLLKNKLERLKKFSSTKEDEFLKGKVCGYNDAIIDILRVIDNIQAKEHPQKEFFEELATKLRSLWPSGEKDGKYPWRDSVENLVKRLEFLWNDRQLGTKYSVEQCLTAARRYLAQYENNTKYMQVLKYFIFKQTKLVAKDGKVTYTYKSVFADMLENNPFTEEELSDNLFNEEFMNQGELV